MAPTTNFNHLFAVASLLLLLLAAQSPPAEARKYIGVNQWCRTAFNRRLCTRMVHGAATQDEAATNAVRTTLEYAKRLQGMIDVVRASVQDLDPAKQQEILDACTDDFDNNVDDLEKTVAGMEAKDQGSVLSHLSAALRPSACDEAMKEHRVTSPITKYTKLWHKEVDNCLAVITQT